MYNLLLFFFSGKQYNVIEPLLFMSSILLLSKIIINFHFAKKSITFWMACGFILLSIIQSIHNGIINLPQVIIPANGKYIPFGLSHLMSLSWLSAWMLLFALALSDSVCKVNIFLSCACIVLYGIIDIKINNQNRFGFFEYVNNAGSFMILITGFLLHKKNWMSYALCAVLLYASYLCKCRFAMIAIIIIIIASIIKIRKMKMVSVFIISTISAILLPYVINQRFHEYITAVKILKEFPLFGAGAGSNYYLWQNFSPSYIIDAYINSPNCHNDWIVFATEYGIVGLLFVLPITITFLMKLLKAKEDCITISIIFVIMHSMIDMPLHNPAILAMIVIYIKMILNKKIFVSS